jgi:hypothetical protein
MNSANTFYVSDYSEKAIQRDNLMRIESEVPAREINPVLRIEPQDSENSYSATDRFFDRSFLGFWKIR